MSRDFLRRPDFFRTCEDGGKVAVKVKAPKKARKVHFLMRPVGKILLLTITLSVTIGLGVFTYYYVKYSRLIETKLASGPFTNTSQGYTTVGTLSGNSSGRLTTQTFNVSLNVLFDTNESTLKPGAAARLDRIASFLQANPRTHLIIEGYTDTTGTAAYNEHLSERRAQAVAEQLETRGVAPDRVQTVGRGQEYPVATNATPAGRQQNRRVEIIFSDTGGRFAQGAEQPTLR